MNKGLRWKYNHTHISAQLAHVRRSAFSSFDLMWNSYGSEEELQALERVVKSGLKINYIHAPIADVCRFCKGDEKVFQQQLAMLHKIPPDICNTIVFHIANDTPVEFTEKAMKKLRILATHARKLGIVLALENAGDIDTLVRIFRETESQFRNVIQLCYDVGHANIFIGRDVLHSHTELFKDRVKVVHLHDNYGEFDEHNLPFTGNADWESAFKFLIECNYQGDLSLEVGQKMSVAVPQHIFVEKAYQSAIALEELYLSLQGKILSNR